MDELARYVHENPDAFLAENGEHFKCSGEALRKAKDKARVGKKALCYTLWTTAKRIRATNSRHPGITPYTHWRKRRVAFPFERRPPRGARAHGFAPGKKQARINAVAGYCDGNTLGEYRYTGPTTSKAFEGWFCRFPLRETSEGDVMDNARFHGKERLKECAKVYKVALVFLPPSRL